VTVAVQGPTMIRKFLSDTLDLILDGLAAIASCAAVGLDRDRMRRRLAVAESDIENRRRAVAATHRMCASAAPWS